VTFVFRPPFDTGASSILPVLTLAMGVAVRAAIGRATGWHPDLKWPNDIVAGRRKLAGILAEGLDVGTPEQTVLIGIGLNLRRTSYPPEIESRATSLESELGRPIERGPVLEEVLVSVPGTYDNLRRGKADDILRTWRSASPSARGSAVEWSTTGGVRRGVTAGIDLTGALLVETASGTERVLGGELTWT
jgi:BirA family biotin operon repressor/biotin-[acetyl-CoA-carboxylase] ligase